MGLHNAKNRLNWTFCETVKQANGTFVKDSSLLPDSNGCIHPRKALVADFNLDAKPDIFVVCHGFDASPYPGEKNKIVISQTNGPYRIQDASPDVGFFHSGSAADLNGDGLIDVIVTNNLDPARAFVLLNQGEGVFQRESAQRLPSSIRGKNYFTVELLDINEDAQLDIILGGHEWEGASTVALINPGNNVFDAVEPVVIPSVENEGVVLDFVVTNNSASALWILSVSDGVLTPSAQNEEIVLDFTTTNTSANILWVLRTSGGDGTFYQSRVIQKVLWSNLTSTVPLLERPGQWFQWIIPTVVNNQKVIASEDASVGVALTQ